MKIVGFIERANMHGEHLCENSRIRGHRGHRRAPELSMIAESEQEPCHPLGAPRDLAMPPLVPELEERALPVELDVVACSTV